jgi:hypothetical protein
VLFKKLFGRSKACYSFWANNIIVTANIATGKIFLQIADRAIIFYFYYFWLKGEKNEFR